jgi:hypothetical protein
MTDRWIIEGDSIIWDVANDANLPHEDHIEMSGRKVSVIVRYGVDENRRLTVAREVIWPMLRTDATDVRGYLRRTYSEDAEFFSNGVPLPLTSVREIRFDGVFRVIYDAPNEGAPIIERTIYPSKDLSAVLEDWTVRNQSASDISLQVIFPEYSDRFTGVYGEYLIENRSPEKQPETITAGDSSVYTQIFGAAISAEASSLWNAVESDREHSQRRSQVAVLRDTCLRIDTPDLILNSAFAFAKLRAAESLFETKMGLVHSPGGGRYYGGIWNNDQCEYSGPLFGYLGDEDAKIAALTAYRNFASYMTTEYKPIPTSLEMEGTIPYHAGGDRGDAAMYAGGASRFALTTGDKAIAEELYPHIVWCLEFCKRKTNAQGVVESDTDELEGRFPTGTANLSTSCLAYDAYRRAADLARSLDKSEDAADYDARADHLAAAIESYFGGMVEGFETYRYYEGNETLRAWICLPLCFGIETPRTSGTIAALFSPLLWTPDGLATEAGDKVFWDRSTLYALRGVFFAGATEIALDYLEAYSRRRLLGEHVPYPVEAYPEGGQAHLSAESALYCRIFTEGIFGMVPTGLRSFQITPRLPEKWPSMWLRNIHAFGCVFNVGVERVQEKERIIVTTPDETILYDRIASPGETHVVALPR